MWLAVLAFVVALALLLYKLNDTYYVLCICKRVKTEDGSPLGNKVYELPGTTIFGNTFDFKDLTPAGLFKFVRDCNNRSQGKSVLSYYPVTPLYSIVKAEDAVEFFQSTELLQKPIFYQLLQDFLGDGLLLSSDRKWMHRRKMLTPAYHFNILREFTTTFKEESIRLVKRLDSMPTDVVEVHEISKEFALNSIIETALGVKLDDITGSAEYRQTINQIEDIFLERIFNMLFYFNGLFRLFGKYEKYKRHLNIVHEFSNNIIQKKKEEYRQKQKGATEDVDEFGKKNRYAMLDTLLAEEAKGNIDHQGICDEVNTFMFEGFDTTSTCLAFTIMNLALHPEAQAKCREEISNLGEFTSLTVMDFNKLMYLECVLKETLRLYPSVPFISRKCSTETRINGLILPANSQIDVHIFDINRDPKHFPDPSAFKPERYFPENTVKRHPFASVAFSAGARNCIGQKFALLEMKVVMVSLLLNYEILPITKVEDLNLEYGIILRTSEKIHVKLRKIAK
uniref:Cytochrome P450 n=1 Tax=Stomoxys calcitrans TaxID=35570 RepID=A0A1I8QDL1_STOCA